MRRFHLIGLGCPKNQCDAEVIWASLTQAGLTAVDEPAEAEVIVVNTCAFLKAAVEESLECILEAARYRKQGRLEQLVVAGCLPGRYREELGPELAEVDLFVGPSEVGRLVELLAHPPGRMALGGSEAFLATAEHPRVNSLSPGAAYLKVAEGCSRRCSFCVIPKIRGPQRSRPIADLVREAEHLVRRGVSELVLVAQDLCAWGRDLTGRQDLSDLTEGLAGVAGVDWIRLMYLYPGEVSDRLLEVVGRNPCVLPYFDIPIQHVDAEVLRRMRRGGDASSTRQLLNRIRALLPSAVLRTSLITGFPGETEAAFQCLLDFVQEVRFERLGVFAFSAEEGTDAALMPDQVPAQVAEERRAALLERQIPIAEAYHRSLVGGTLEAIVEGISEDGTLLGRAWNQAPEVDGECRLRGQASLGEIVLARIRDADPYDLEGDIVV